MGSACCRTPIIASILTLLLVPTVNHNQKTGYKLKVAPITYIGCDRTEPIPPTPYSERRGVSGRICDSWIVVVKKLLAPQCESVRQAKRGKCIRIHRPR